MPQAPAPPEGHINHLASLYTQNAGNRPAKKTFRAVPSAPERILDAPDLVDDYYLNLLDWSSTNVVSILFISAIERALYNGLCPSLCTCHTQVFVSMLVLLILSQRAEWSYHTRGAPKW